MPRYNSAILFFATLLLTLTANPIYGQRVHVYEDPQPLRGDSVGNAINVFERDQKVLVIPVVTQDYTDFDPDDNDLSTYNPTLLNELRTKLETVSDFWEENSYGQVSFDATVLDRFYQLPLEFAEYVNPDYVQPALVGSSLDDQPITIPTTGSMRLNFHVFGPTVTPIIVRLDAGDYTYAELETTIGDQLSAVGDQLRVQVYELYPGLNQLVFNVPDIYVSRGTYIHLDFDASDAALLDILGLDRPEEDVSPAMPTLTTRGTEFPFETQNNSTLRVILGNDSGVPYAVSWDFLISDGTARIYDDAEDFVGDHGNTNLTRGCTIEATPEGQLKFIFDPSSFIGPPVPPPYQGIAAFVYDAGGREDLVTLDRFGLDKSVEHDGVVALSRSGTTRYARSTASHAVSAYILNELNRPPDGGHPIPMLAIQRANEDAIDDVVREHIDIYDNITVVFLNASGPPRRAVASVAPRLLDIGIFNDFGNTDPADDYLYEFQSYASLIIGYEDDEASTFAHEMGHNLGFWDFYDNSDGTYDRNLRYAGAWDTMHSHSSFPHTGVYNKEIKAAWLSGNGATVHSFSEPSMPGDVSERYVVTPVEFSPDDYDDQAGFIARVPPGRRLVKAIRLPLGTDPEAAENHFLMVQNRARGETYSGGLPQEPGAAQRGGLYITDSIKVNLYNFFERPTTRNLVHPLTDRALPDRSVPPILDRDPMVDINLLGAYPAYDGISVDIVGVLSGPPPWGDRPSYLVDVTRSQSDFLDLSITRGDPPYMSPDIWIEHADGPLSPDPLTGNGEPARWSDDYDPSIHGGLPLNYIRVKVTNNGAVLARDVRVRVKVNSPPGMGDQGGWETLPLSAPQDIPGNGRSAIFNVDWSPTVDQHTCVLAEVAEWSSLLGDINPLNNMAQENVFVFNPTPGSPWSATSFSFNIANDREHTLDVVVLPRQLPKGYIVSLQQDFIQIPPKSRVLLKGILRLDDAIIPTPKVPKPNEKKKMQDIKLPKPGHFDLEAYVLTGDHGVPIGGIRYRVFPTIDIKIDADIKVGPKGNIVVTGKTNPRVPGEKMEVQVRYPSGRYEWIPFATDSKGGFKITISPKEQGKVRVMVNYPKGGRFAPTTTGKTWVMTKPPKLTEQKKGK